MDKYSKIKNQIIEIMEELSISYYEKKQNGNIWFLCIYNTKEVPAFKFRLLINVNNDVLVFFAEETCTFKISEINEVYKLVNDINANSALGTIYILDNKINLSSGISMEGDDIHFTLEQMFDYIANLICILDELKNRLLKRGLLRNKSVKSKKNDVL